MVGLTIVELSAVGAFHARQPQRPMEMIPVGNCIARCLLISFPIFEEEFDDTQSANQVCLGSVKLLDSGKW